MDKFSIILSSLLAMTLVVLIAPSIIAMNRGKILRNIALWLAIALSLALLYQTVGPGKDKQLSTSMSEDNESNQADEFSKDDFPADGQDFTPPKE